MEEIRHLSELSVLHWFLAYAGFLVHLLLKLSRIKGSFKKGFTRKDVFVSLASIILIPIILIICTDTFMKDVLPINFVTAFLAGYQTQETLKVISRVTNKTENENEGTTV